MASGGGNGDIILIISGHRFVARDRQQQLLVHKEWAMRKKTFKIFKN
jgi:hypothetical protein